MNKMRKKNDFKPHYNSFNFFKNDNISNSTGLWNIYLKLTLNGVTVTRNFSRWWGCEDCIPVPVILEPSAKK